MFATKVLLKPKITISPKMKRFPSLLKLSVGTSCSHGSYPNIEALLDHNKMIGRDGSPVIFLREFFRHDQYCLVVIMGCHQITDTVLYHVSPALRVIKGKRFLSGVRHIPRTNEE